MLNNRTLFPALFRPAGSGGGGSGQTIQVAELPEAVLAEKDKIYQYIGSSTKTLTNGYFYKCVEHTTTEGDVITVTYEWENIPVMYVEPPTSSIDIPLNGEVKIGTIGSTDIYACCIENPTNNGYSNAEWIKALNISAVYSLLGGFYTSSNITIGRPIDNIKTDIYWTTDGLYIQTSMSSAVLHNVVILYSKN